MSRALLELLGHAQVLLEMRQGLRCPALELRIIPALGIGFEQRDRILVALNLGLLVALVEVLAALGFQVIEQLLMFESNAVGSFAFTLPPSIKAFSSLEVF